MQKEALEETEEQLVNQVLAVEVEVVTSIKVLVAQEVQQEQQ